MTELKDRLKYIRTEVLHLTQEKFAKVLGLRTKQVITGYEKGDWAPKLEMLIKIAEMANVSLDWLILGKEFGEPKTQIVSEPEPEYKLDELSIEDQVEILREEVRGIRANLKEKQKENQPTEKKSFYHGKKVNAFFYKKNRK